MKYRFQLNTYCSLIHLYSDTDPLGLIRAFLSHESTPSLAHISRSSLAIAGPLFVGRVKLLQLKQSP